MKTPVRGAVDGAYEFPCEMLQSLERAVERPDMTHELSQLLSTRAVTLNYRIETDLSID